MPWTRVVMGGRTLGSRCKAVETADRKATLPMFQDAPIYHQLIAERGDVPARVRDAAASIRRDLDAVMQTGHSIGSFESGTPLARPAMPSHPALPPAPPLL